MPPLERAVDLSAPHFAGLGDVGALLADALIAGLTIPPDVTVSRWAEDKRIVSAESGSSEPGPWRNARAPYGAEPMDCLSNTHPCTDVTFVGGAQIIKSEIGVNFVGSTIDVAPAAMLIVLPSIDEAQKFNRTKLDPTIEATPALRHKVKEVKSRDETGSTASYKRFRGGFIQLTHAGSSKGLQAITVKHIWGDEISEFPLDAGGRGDPIEQMRQRNSTYVLKGGKALWTSTPKIKGQCRVTAFYEASDQRRWYWECPHCGDYSVFRFEHLKWESARAPHGAYLETPCCRNRVAHWQKAQMNARGVWIKTFPAADEAEDGCPGTVIPAAAIEDCRARKNYGRQPGFHLWRGQSAFHDWDSIVTSYLAAKDYPEKLKTFTQQILGEAYEQSGEAPDHLKLLARREDREGGTLPDGVLAVTGMCDVQANRLVWAVYGWGEKLSCWLIDRGVIGPGTDENPGDPDKDATWAELAQITTRLYEDSYGRTWPIEAFGVDSGFKSHAVYNFARRRPNVFATDGRDGATRPFVGTPKKVDVNWRGKMVRGGCLLWPLGTHPLKSALYAALQKTIDGASEVTGLWPAGCIRFTKDCDETFFLELTAEYLEQIENREGFAKGVWKKRAGQANEQLDIWVGARAMAAHIGLDRHTPAKWAARAALHAAPEAGGADDLLAHAARIEPKTQGVATAARAVSPRPKRRVIASGFMGN